MIVICHLSVEDMLCKGTGNRDVRPAYSSSSGWNSKLYTLLQFYFHVHSIVTANRGR